jgi:nitroreductase
MTLPLTPDELLTTTRSVRKRLDLTRPVPLEVIRECLEVALQAPSGSNRQGWHWLVVTDPEKKRVIADHYRRSATEYASSGSSTTPATYADDPERADTQRRVLSSSAYLMEHMHEVPVLVIGCIEAPPERLNVESQASLWGSLLPAAWSFMLAARARGLGAAWTTLHLRYEAEIAELLGIPEGVRQGVLLPTAYTVGTDFRPAPRVPLDQVLHVDTW